MRLLLLGALAASLSSPALARELVFDRTPVADAVRIAAGKLGGSARICKPVAGTVTGRFDFPELEAVGPMLAEKGYPVSWEPDGRPSVGCDVVADEQAGSVVPVFGGSGAFGGAPGSSAPPARPAPPPEPQERVLVDVRYRDPSKVAEAISKLPGLSVLSFPDAPGPLMLSGPASIVGHAEEFVRALDTCPRQVELQALVISIAENVGRRREFGIGVVGDSVRIGDQTIGDNFVNVGGLVLRLGALRERGEFRANRSFVARVVEGESVQLGDGQQIAIRAGAIITDRETRDNIVYRDVGHNLTFGLDVLSDRFALLSILHQISSVTGNTALGPTFANLSTETVARVELGEWQMISLAGSDRAERTSGRGFLSRRDHLVSEQNGTFLLFVVAELPCGQAGREYLDRPALPADAAPDEPKGKARGKR